MTRNACLAVAGVAVVCVLGTAVGLRAQQTASLSPEFTPVFDGRSLGQWTPKGGAWKVDWLSASTAKVNKAVAVPAAGDAMLQEFAVTAVIAAFASATLKLISPLHGNRAMRSSTSSASDWPLSLTNAAISSHGTMPVSQYAKSLK